MEVMKIRLKVGVHEFEAEGPPEEVKAQLAVWQELVGAAGTRSVATGSGTGAAQGPGDDGTAESGADGGKRLFAFDDRRDLITLRAHPVGDTREADAGLLIVYGYRLLRDVDEVLVTKLREALRVSGLNVDRIDRAVAPHLAAGYLMKTGRAKGGKYRLTNTGMDYAKRMSGELAAAMA